jgi:excisionase family DNA binding protein
MSEPQLLPQLLSIADFCREFKTSRSNVYCMIRDRTLRAVKVGKMTRIRRLDAEAWAASLPPAGRSKRKPTAKPAATKKPGKKPPQRTPASISAARDSTRSMSSMRE